MFVIIGMQYAIRIRTRILITEATRGERNEWKRVVPVEFEKRITKRRTPYVFLRGDAEGVTRA